MPAGAPFTGSQTRPVGETPTTRVSGTTASITIGWLICVRAIGSSKLGASPCGVFLIRNRPRIGAKTVGPLCDCKLVRDLGGRRVLEPHFDAIGRRELRRSTGTEAHARQSRRFPGKSLTVKQ